MNDSQFDDIRLAYREAELDLTQLVEVYEDEELLEVLIAQDVIDLLKQILDEDLDDGASKYAPGSEYFKVLALKIAARAFIERVVAEEDTHSKPPF